MSTMDDDVTNSFKTTYSGGSRMVLIFAPHSPPKENSSREPRHPGRPASLVLPLASAPQAHYPGRTFRHYQIWHAFLLAFVNPETTTAVLLANWHISGAVCFGILFALNIPRKKGG